MPVFETPSLQSEGVKQEQNREYIVESREQALLAVKSSLLNRLRARFSEQGEMPLDYHGPAHSLEVGGTTKAFLQKIRDIDPELVSAEDVVLGELEGIAHDVVQEGVREEAKNLKRKVEYNEYASAAELLEEMGRYYYPDGSAVFPTKDEKFCNDIIDNIGTTIPEFAYAELPDGSKGIRISQKKLTKKSSLRALALASADLRGEFMQKKEPASFFASGDAEFREISLPVREDIGKGIGQITPKRRAEIATLILDWKHSQVGFVKRQKILFYESIEKNEAIAHSPKAEEIRKVLADMFSEFDTMR